MCVGEGVEGPRPAAAPESQRRIGGVGGSKIGRHERVEQAEGSATLEEGKKQQETERHHGSV